MDGQPLESKLSKYKLLELIIDFEISPGVFSCKITRIFFRRRRPTLYMHSDILSFNETRFPVWIRKTETS